MSTRLNLIGHVYGRLTVLNHVEGARWRCVCECGEFVVTHSVSLRKGSTKSCGCLRREVTAAKTLTHGATNTREYTSWKAMRQRCLNTNHHQYADYGGRGITVCDRWSTFAGFLADMGSRPEGTSLDRIDVNGSYEPSNCRWATTHQQGSNRRNTIYVDGFDLKLIAEVVGVPYSTLYSRLWRAKRRKGLSRDKL